MLALDPKSLRRANQLGASWQEWRNWKFTARSAILYQARMYLHLTCRLELSCPMDNSQRGEYNLLDHPTSQEVYQFRDIQAPWTAPGYYTKFTFHVFFGSSFANPRSCRRSQRP